MKFATIINLVTLVSGVSAFAPSKNPYVATSSLSSSVDDKTEVREYFNTEGFNRWNKIYSESDDVNSVQLDIRTGHDQTIQKILKWVKEDGNIAGKSVCDCGCGVGSLAIPLAQMGKRFLVHLSHLLKMTKFSRTQSFSNHTYLSIPNRGKAFCE